MNNNQLVIYGSTGGVPVSDPDEVISRAEQIRFSTVYPGGIFADASFFIPCDPTRYHPIRHTQRLQIKNGLQTVWEGFITSYTIVVSKGETGLDVQATGYWALSNERYKYNRWIDRRYSSNIYGVWTGLESEEGGGSKIEFDQTDQLFLRPKQEQWGGGETAYMTYLANGSSDIKRIKFSYDFGETAEINPVRAKKYTSIGASYSANLTNLIDGNSGSSQTVSMATSDYLYIGLDDPASVTGIRFDFGATVNANAATLTVEYSDVSGGWTAFSITDGTVTAGAPWAKDGAITWTEVDGWDTVAVNGSQKFYYLRISTSAGLTSNVVVIDVYVQRTQQWTLFLNDLRNSTTLWSTSTAGTGTQDLSLGTPTDYIGFGITSVYSQKVVGVGVYGKITDLSLTAQSHDGTAKTTVGDIMEDMVHYLSTPFADDYTFIAANTYDLLATGFVSDDLQTSLADDMQRIGQFSATDEPYSVGAVESDMLSATNTAPVVYYEKIPALTDYDYAVRLDEDNLDGVELVTSSEVGTLYNRAFVVLTTPNGKTQWANLADYAALDDTTSQGKYYIRTKIVNGGQAETRALAGPIGAVQIEASKDLAYYVRSPLVLRGTVRKKDGSSVPVSHMRAGKRIKIENFSTDVGDLAGSGLTFLITRTEYDDDSGSIAVTCGVPDDLATYMAATR